MMNDPMATPPQGGMPQNNMAQGQTVSMDDAVLDMHLTADVKRALQSKGVDISAVENRGPKEPVIVIPVSVISNRYPSDSVEGSMKEFIQDMTQNNQPVSASAMTESPTPPQGGLGSPTTMDRPPMTTQSQPQLKRIRATCSSTAPKGDKMEENNQEIQEQDQTTEALLEPTPYRNKYKKDLDKEETEDTATVSKDTSDEDATPDEERPVDAEEKVFKKRYDDLKRHYDSTLVKHKEQVNSLESQLKENVDKINLPKTKDEVDAWKQKYPDVYDIIETIAYTKAEEKAKKVEADLKNLETEQIAVKQEKAEVELARLHPDYQDLRKNEDFHKWVDEQDDIIKGWLYSNATNAKLAARAIDLYKSDKNITKQKSNSKLEASKSVTSTSKKDVDASVKKVWKVSEISKLKPAQFEKFEKEIDLARKEGRIVNG